jgi:aspartyl-tRNA(Asn)/glutamyl-tRNA(Gln) amidotransferase subunit B
MFCDSPVEFGSPANQNVCPVCLGLPGALPRANRAAIDSALRLGLALGCEARAESVFARKNYFYPDMPKNYQITQYDRPLCEGGALPVTLEGGRKEFPLIRIHVEEDTGKSFHPERHGDRRISRVEFNRAGVPLLELVTQPAFHDPAECAAFLLALRRLVRWLGISDGDMEKGQLRCDANVSLRPVGREALGTKTEIKNLNSIKAVEKGLLAEIARQGGVLDSGGRIEQATLLFDADHDRLAVMRTKEHAHDYRYFPEPDLPLLKVDAAWMKQAASALPELPWTRAERFVREYGLPAYDAGVLSEDREYSDLADRVIRDSTNRKLASNFLMNRVLKFYREERAGRALNVEHLVQFNNVTAARFPGPLANRILEMVLEQGTDPESVVAKSGFKVPERSDLVALVRAALDENPGPVAQYLAGKSATLGFLVGQVMKKSEGQAVPQVVQELLKEELATRGGGA